MTVNEAGLGAGIREDMNRPNVRCQTKCQRCHRFTVAFMVVIVPALSVGGDAKPPSSVAELYADFDPRKEPLDTRLIREWEHDGIVFRAVTFHIGTFRGKPSRMGAFFAFPKGATKQPGLLHLHGGGQRAFLHEVTFYAKRGYPCLSINWGGREMEEAHPGDPNTDWGAVNPTQTNVPGYFNLKPGETYPDSVDSPRNNNWYLLILGARRGLTFLEQQPEVDPDRLGVYGHSMGGNLTVYVAGCDSRVQAAAPSVGGSGFRTRTRPLLPEYRPQLPNGDVALFDASLGFESYAPRINAPLLWLGSTNDFHGVMDDTYLTGALIPHVHVRYAFAPHLNHRFVPEFSVARPLWFDQHLRGRFQFPATPDSKLILSTKDHVPEFVVTPDATQPIADVRVYYSLDPEPRARFWRSAEVVNTGTHWSARLPIPSTRQPLFAFANVSWAIARSESEPYAAATEQLALSSLLHTATPAELEAANIQATDRPSSVIHEVRDGWRDWYLLSQHNPHHWEYSTRKLNDPKWRGTTGQLLKFEVQADLPNDLVCILTENFFRSYRGPQREGCATVRLNGGTEPQTVAFQPTDFIDADGQALSSWKEIDLLSVRAYFERGGKLIGSKDWRGPQPVIRKIWWANNDQ